MELEDGSTVGDALRRIRMSPLKAKLLLLSVNGERAPLSRALHDGDVIGFFLPVSGG
jgi:molybdopterin converting factor small subunit